MIKRLLLLFLVVSCAKENTKPLLAPSAKAIDTLHGQKIQDPYRNLENLEDSTVVNWLKAHGKKARLTLESIPGRETLIDLQNKLSSSKREQIHSIKMRQNGNLFYLKRKPKDDYYKLYWRITRLSDVVSSSYTNVCKHWSRVISRPKTADL